MARINTATSRKKIHTHEGAIAAHINPIQQLRRLVMAHMLWEDQFYIDGKTAVEQLAEAIKHVDAEHVSTIAIEARERQKLRHVPLFMCRVMAALSSHRHVVAETLARVIQRPDELTEYVAIYWKDGRQTLSAQSKRGLAAAFTKFDEYQLEKYNRDGAVKLRDVLFLSHAKPKDDTQKDLWKRLVDGKLTVPDTWEVALSDGADKREVFERLISEGKLGALALLRNLRNMTETGVPKAVIGNALQNANLSRVLPFRFISAAKHAPKLEDEIERAMFRATTQQPKLPGKTILVIDTSGSMHSGQVSKKSELTRVDAATALAILVREVCEEPVLYATAGDDGRRIHATKEVPARRGFALSDALWGHHMRSAIGDGGIFLKQSLDFIKEREKTADRIIVITDEQDCDIKANPSTADAFGGRNYIINVSVYQNGIAYDKFTHINGWSEAVLDFIRESEFSEQ